MTHAQTAMPGADIDFGVVISRVRVVTNVRERSAQASGELQLSPFRQSRASGDCRILIGDLIIETSASMDDATAHQLGRDVSRMLVDELELLQTKRLQAALRTQSATGPITIGALRVKLYGAEANHLSPFTIGRELVSTIERRVPQ
ncbi:MAG TPA: hypothetical protein VIV60_01130 [Polyangiaceae bacterium]